MDKKGKVYIIGSGPGDYKLLTLKAIEAIKQADVVIYDRLGSNKINRFTKENVEYIYVGKMPDKHETSQEDINKIIVRKALEGKVVARIKGGDPFVFGRGGEECEILVKENIEFEVVPGITSPISVPAYAGIPITHRDFCSSFHVITGHEMPGRENSFLDYENLAKLKGTMIFLMGVKNIPHISSNLIKYGKSQKTPVAVIQKGTTSDQRVIKGTLEDIAKKIEINKIKPPAIIVIGEVVKLADKLNWFPKGDLAGKKILVTRAREQASELVDKIEELGAEAIEFPVIKISKPDTYEKIDKAIQNINIYSWLVFTSVNGVKSFFSRMKFLKKDIRKLLGIKICAVGSATKEEIENLGITVDVVPKNFITKDLTDEILKRVDADERILLARSDIANKDITNAFFEKGISFDDLVVYKTQVDDGQKDSIICLLDSKKLDCITFTSSSTVLNFLRALGQENLSKLSQIKIACIGPITAKAATDSGIKVDLVADTYTIDGLVQKILQAF